MIINSAISSTKDNSIHNNNNKKKIFLSSKTNNTNSNSEIVNQTPKKEKIIISENTVYEGYIKDNKFEGYGEYHSPKYNYIGFYTSGKKNGKGKLEDLSENSIYNL